MTHGSPRSCEPIPAPPDQEDKPNRVLVVTPDDDHTVLATIATALSGADMVIVTDVTGPPQDDKPLRSYRSRVGLLGVGGMDGIRPTPMSLFGAMAKKCMDAFAPLEEPPMPSSKNLVAERHGNNATRTRPNKHDRKKLRRGR